MYVIEALLESSESELGGKILDIITNNHPFKALLGQHFQCLLDKTKKVEKSSEPLIIPSEFTIRREMITKLVNQNLLYKAFEHFLELLKSTKEREKSEFIVDTLFFDLE